MRRFLNSAALLLASTFVLNSQALDWPQWGGPGRDHASKEKGLLQEWPQGGPKQVWLNKDAGLGYAGISVADGKVFTMGARGDMEFLIAMDAKDGKELWATEMAPILKNRWGDGPRGTPTFVDGRVYALSGRGALVAADAKDGKVIWKKQMEKDLGGKIPGWGYTESILVHDGVAYCTPGGKDGAIAALDARTGDVKWQSAEFKIPEAHYSSIVFATINGSPQLVQLTEKDVVGLDPKNGKLLWRTDFPGKTAVIPSPVVKDNYVYVTAGYNAGCKLVKIGPGNKVEEVYSNDVMGNHHGGVVLIDGHIYGYSDGKGWVCQEFLSGNLVWADKTLGKGAVTYADNRLYCLDEAKGTVVLAEASPKGWQEHGRFVLQPQTTKRSPSGRIWTHPVIANGKLYLRDQELVSSYDISGSRQVAGN